MRLGKGGFAAVTKVRRKSDGKVLACKSIDIKDTAILFAAQREADILKSLAGCPNIVQWTDDVSIDPRALQVHLHMEYYPHGSLRDYINSHWGTASKDSVVQIWCCMATALAFCHGKGILHRDIKPDNSQSILIGETKMVAAMFGY
ncbi:hypothetical protein ACHAPY_011506 [Fusarium culmorum]